MNAVLMEVMQYAIKFSLGVLVIRYILYYYVPIVIMRVYNFSVTLFVLNFIYMSR